MEGATCRKNNQINSIHKENNDEKKLASKNRGGTSARIGHNCRLR